MIDRENRFIRNLEELSLKQHRLSLLFHELAQSLRIELRQKNTKEVTKILKSYDFSGVKKFHFESLKLLKGGKN